MFIHMIINVICIIRSLKKRLSFTRNSKSQDRDVDTVSYETTDMNTIRESSPGDDTEQYQNKSYVT